MGKIKSTKGDSTMRIAIAGTNTLALLIAHYFVEETSHQIVVLSRTSQPLLINHGYQVLEVAYDNPIALQHAVMGVDVVISTATGPNGLLLLHAAVQQHVARFIPAEFEGQPSNQPALGDGLDLNGSKKTIRQWLEHYKMHNGLQYTLPSCGVLYERFSPGGLRNHRLGFSASCVEEGDFVVNIRSRAVNTAIYTADGQDAYLAMTSIDDVAQMIVRAVDLPKLPLELIMIGERLSIRQLVGTIVQVFGPLNTPIAWTPDLITYEMQTAQAAGDPLRARRAYDHLAVLAGRYDLPVELAFNRERVCKEITLINFEDWLRRVWAAATG